AVLRLDVSEAEGRGIADKVSRLPGVASALYKSPEDAWKEFAAAYPGLESLRDAGGNPLPGYVEIRLRPDRLSEEGVASVETALRPLPQVDDLLTGGRTASRLLRVKRWVDAALWAGFALMAAAFFAVFVVQEKARALGHAADFDFVAARGASARGVALRRAGAASLCGGFLALVSLGAAAAAYHLLGARYSLVGAAVGSPLDLLVPDAVAAPVLFILSAALLSGAASVAGWRAARR
ncbi:MAG: cell division protein FtsX, partial [Gemmatimonadota bacterium]